MACREVSPSSKIVRLGWATGCCTPPLPCGGSSPGSISFSFGSAHSDTVSGSPSVGLGLDGYGHPRSFADVAASSSANATVSSGRVPLHKKLSPLPRGTRLISLQNAPMYIEKRIKTYITTYIETYIT